MHAAATTHPAARTSPGRDLTLDDLAARSFDELEALYRAAARPKSMRAADGALIGRMLAVRLVESSPIAAPLRAFAGSSAFVWEGKSFRATSDDEGSGINRIKIPGALGRQSLFPFATRFGAGALDGREALILDYDLEENPPWIRKIHDEVREVAPGVFLGPAMWKGAHGATTLLWFALDARASGVDHAARASRADVPSS